MTGQIPSQIAEAHKHWDHYGTINEPDSECAKWAAFEAACERGNWSQIDAALTQVSELAKSYGYACADGTISRYGTPTPTTDQLISSAVPGVGRDDSIGPDSDYGECVARSLRGMIDRSSAPELSEWLNVTARQAIEQALAEGWDNRAAQHLEPAAAPEA